VWRVVSGNSTLVIVGSLRDVTADTRWNPAALTETVRRADRVMFPDVLEVKISPFQAIGYLRKWRAQARLPKGQRLTPMLPAGSGARLAGLSRQKLAPANYDAWHPLHLAFKIQDALRDRTRMGPDARKIVDQAVRKHKVRRLPIARGETRALANTLFGSTPASHVPCLVDTLAMAEAGTAGLRQRSQDWARQRIQRVLAAAAERPGRSCWPASSKPQGDLLLTARQALRSGGTTVAVIELDSLARPGALLHDLVAAGFKLDGPDWRR
jgi:uncharacterized protein YbaP (TraB family)